MVTNVSVQGNEGKLTRLLYSWFARVVCRTVKSPDRCFLSILSVASPWHRLQASDAAVVALHSWSNWGYSQKTLAPARYSLTELRTSIYSVTEVKQQVKQ